MSKFNVKVKWNKETYNVEVDVSEPPIVFKSQLYALTNVPPERQKIMLKGMLKSDDDWGTFKSAIKDGVTIMMMGTPDEQIISAPKQTIAFAEDLPEEERENALSNLPPGLINLENTCYFNATLQTLNCIPELTRHLLTAKENTAQGDGLIAQLRDVIRQLKTSKSAVMPLALLTRFRLLYPNFAEQTNGRYSQQDAEEAWTQLLYSLQALPRINEEIPGENAVQQLFQGEFETTYKNLEAEQEPVTKKMETFLKLQCYIQITTNFLNDGLNLEEKISKRSELLNREAEYQKISRISKIPYYLTVQFVRFYWKPGQVKSKIVRPVQFPFEFDAYDFCSDELKKKLDVNRKILAEAREKDVEPQLNLKPLVNETGFYELVAVITHKGLSADGGHYVSWIKDDANNRWLLFDDDRVSECTEEDIRKLDGKQSAQWHMAYILLYRTKTNFSKKK